MTATARAIKFDQSVNRNLVQLKVIARALLHNQPLGNAIALANQLGSLKLSRPCHMTSVNNCSGGFATRHKFAYTFR